VKIKSFVIENKFLRVKTINLGATLYEVFHKKKKTNLILNLGSISSYKYKNFYVGATCGRFAGRIAGSKFQINKQKYYLNKNEGINTLHGGKKGFDRFVWKKINQTKSKIVYQLKSKHLDQGFPGNLDIKCIYELEDKILNIRYEYISDQFTHVNLTNHSYWNLNYKKNDNIFNHNLKINSDKYLVVNKKLIPTGKIKRTKKTINDFNYYENLGKKIKLITNNTIQKISNTINQSGFDLTFCVNKNHNNFVASLKNDDSKIKLNIYSSLPGVQLYTSQSLKYKKKLFPYQGICLETQYYPDTPNRKNFPSTLIKPNKLYKHFTKIKVS